MIMIWKWRTHFDRSSWKSSICDRYINIKHRISRAHTQIIGNLFLRAVTFDHIHASMAMQADKLRSGADLSDIKNDSTGST